MGGIDFHVMLGKTAGHRSLQNRDYSPRRIKQLNNTHG